MDKLLFNVNEAIEFYKKGDIEEWVHLFLNSVGNNKPFSEGLKLQKRYWIGPILIDIDKLTRCCGPEPEMQYYNSPESWDKHIEKFQDLIRDGWDMPPLIAENKEGKLIVNDGNHRIEALKRENIKKCWAIIWDSDSEENIKQFEEYLAS
ncbi:ParB N-terminal domain-containing protein [Oceanirhabdus sp. W0125-5]|uniref:ParB N-terminal domain-containing protein n=1 Tax=Oceanirhabdus sp. W0125-5 TaxID=2999116 RepID=UPI0022F2D6F3|nr:ParB N-terminal domain-containing protein [Oceanirhabdus sp. W0125-5]WBW95567.1 ParB N-terminal domain-containing protein [Oceanirhabdus sp. W0125-5]